MHGTAWHSRPRRQDETALHLGPKHASDLEPRISSGELEKNTRPEQDQEFSAEGSTFLSDPNNLSCQVSGR